LWCSLLSSLLPTEMHCTMQPQPQPSQRQQVETIVKSLCAFQDREKKNQMPETLTHSANTTLTIHKAMNIVHGMICNMLIHDVHCFVQSKTILEDMARLSNKSGVVPTGHQQRRICDLGGQIHHNCQKLRSGHSPWTMAISITQWTISAHRSLKDSLTHVIAHRSKDQLQS
jgi:hypothetical protein